MGAAAPGELLVVDGPLGARRLLPGTVGYIKTHHVSYLPTMRFVGGVASAWRWGRPYGNARPSSAWGSASPPQLVPATARRGQPSLGGRGARGGDGRRAGAGMALADRLSAVLPRFAPSPHKDPRVEPLPDRRARAALRRRLGDPLLIQRACARPAAVARALRAAGSGRRGSPSRTAPWRPTATTPWSSGPGPCAAAAVALATRPPCRAGRPVRGRAPAAAAMAPVASSATPTPIRSWSGWSSRPPCSGTSCRTTRSEILLEEIGALDHGNPAAVDALTDAMAVAGVPFERLPPDAAAERWPHLRFEGTVVHQPTAGRCLADATVAALLRRAEEHGQTCGAGWGRPRSASTVTAPRAGRRGRARRGRRGGDGRRLDGQPGRARILGRPAAPGTRVTEEQLVHFPPAVGGRVGAVGQRHPPHRPLLVRPPVARRRPQGRRPPRG